MKIRNEWMTDEIYFGEGYPNNVLIRDAKRRYIIQRDYSLEGKEAKIDGVSQRIVVQDHTNIVGQRYDKKIHCDVDSNVLMGSVVEFDDKLWLVIGKIFENPAYKITGVMECNNVVNGIPVLIESQAKLHSMGIWDEKYFPVTDSNIIMMMPNNDITKLFKRNDVYQLAENENYMIVDLNKVITPGIIVAKLEWVINSIQDTPLSPPSLPVPGYVIDGVDLLKTGQIMTYIAKKYVEIETIIVEDKEAKFKFSIIGDAPTSAYTLTINKDDKSCTIKCNGFPHTIILQAEDKDTGDTVNKPIKLISFL